MCTRGQAFQGLSGCLRRGAGVARLSTCAHVHVHIWAVSTCWQPLGGFSASALDTHIFPIQAWLAVIARLSLREQIIGQKAGLR